MSAVSGSVCPPITGQSFVRYRLGGKGRMRYTEQPRRMPPRKETFNSPRRSKLASVRLIVRSETPARLARSACEVRVVPSRSSRQSSNQTAISLRLSSHNVTSQKSFSERNRSFAWWFFPGPFALVRVPLVGSSVSSAAGSVASQAATSDFGILEVAIVAPVVIGHSGAGRVP